MSTFISGASGGPTPQLLRVEIFIQPTPPTQAWTEFDVPIVVVATTVKAFRTLLGVGF